MTNDSSTWTDSHHSIQLSHCASVLNDFIASRRWTTPQIFYGDQLEPAEGAAEPLWSFCFCLGLDHIHASKWNWRKDVRALVGFLQEAYAETGREIVMDVRYSSRLWYSGHIAFIDDRTPTVETICSLIERVA